MRQTQMVYTRIAPQHETDWLVFSSCLFLFPCVYAVIYRMWFYATVLWATSFFSCVYWIYPIHGFRRNMDLWFSKVAFFVFFGSGILYVRPLPFALIGYSGAVIIGVCFYMSHATFDSPIRNWWKFHVWFHILLMCEQFLVLHCIYHRQS